MFLHNINCGTVSYSEMAEVINVVAPPETLQKEKNFLNKCLNLWYEKVLQPA